MWSVQLLKVPLYYNSINYFSYHIVTSDIKLSPGAAHVRSTLVLSVALG